MIIFFQTSKQKMAEYKNVVVRIQFPDGIILQGVFQPTNTIEDVVNFVKGYLRTPQQKFHICKLQLIFRYSSSHLQIH